MCQWCSDERCRLCLASDAGCRKKLSLAEQIALYERLNSREDKDYRCRPEKLD